MNCLKLQNQQNNKKSGSNKKPNQASKPQYIPLNKEEGYKLVQDAIKHENDKKYNKAIDFYEKGLKNLEESLISIQDSKEKEKRRQKIRDWRSRQQFCKNQLQNKQNNTTKKQATKKSKKTKKLAEEPGYQYCQKAKQFEKENKFDIAINHYEKGIPLLEDTLKFIDSSAIKRERQKLNFIDMNYKKLRI